MKLIIPLLILMMLSLSVHLLAGSWVSGPMEQIPRIRNAMKRNNYEEAIKAARVLLDILQSSSAIREAGRTKPDENGILVTHYSEPFATGVRLRERVEAFLTATDRLALKEYPALEVAMRDFEEMVRGTTGESKPRGHGNY